MTQKVQFKGIQLLCGLLLTIAVLIPGMTIAEVGAAEIPPAGQEPDARSVLLVLQLAQTDDDELLENRFIEELSLAVDHIRIQPIWMENDQFVGMSPGEQISAIKPAVRANEAIAAIWLEPGGDGFIWLHLLAVSEHRALARTVELKRVNGIESDLAYVTRELLSAAFVFHAPDDVQAVEPPMKKKTDNDTTAALSPDEVSKQSEELAACLKKAEHQLLLRFFSAASGAIVSYKGPSLMLGGGLGVDYIGSSGWGLQGSLYLNGGFLDSSDAMEISAIGFRPQFALLYHKQLTNFSLAVSAGAHFRWLTLTVTPPEKEKQRFSSHNYAAQLGVDFQLPILKSRRGLFVGGGVSVYPEQEKLVRDTNNASILKTPRWAWEGRVGVFF